MKPKKLKDKIQKIVEQDRSFYLSKDTERVAPLLSQPFLIPTISLEELRQKELDRRASEDKDLAIKITKAIHDIEKEELLAKERKHVVIVVGITAITMLACMFVGAWWLK